MKSILFDPKFTHFNILVPLASSSYLVVDTFVKTSPIDIIKTSEDYFGWGLPYIPFDEGVDIVWRIKFLT